MTAVKLGSGWYRKTSRSGEYVRKYAGKANTYLSSKLVLLDHEGCGVKSEGIDGQARQTEGGPVYPDYTPSTRFSLEQARDGEPYSVAEAASARRTRPRIH